MYLHDCNKANAEDRSFTDSKIESCGNRLIRGHSFYGLSQRMVLIEVGPNKDVFNVHVDLLYKYSSRLTTELQSVSQDGKTCKLRLPQVETQIFNAFLDWLYFGRGLYDSASSKTISCANRGTGCATVAGQAKHEVVFRTLTAEEEQELEKTVRDTNINRARHECSLYVLAVRQEIPALKRAIVDAAWKYYKKNPGAPYRAIIYLSRRVTADDPYLRLLIDSVKISDALCDAFQCPTEKQLLQKVPPAVHRRFWLNAVAKTDGCHKLCSYHEHEQDDATVTACEQQMAASRKRKRDELED